jgi:hypothetical protein
MTALERAAKPRGVIQPIAPRLEAKTHRIPFCGCHVFVGASTPFGYGVLSVNDRQSYAHRVSWELVNGPIPSGMRVLHRCDVASCINPDHLFLGTDADNVRDMMKKGRAVMRGTPPGYRNPNPLRGEQSGGAKLSAAQVQEIRRRYLEGEFQTDLAADFGIKQAQISRIVRGESWK